MVYCFKVANRKKSGENLFEPFACNSQIIFNCFNSKLLILSIEPLQIDLKLRHCWALHSTLVNRRLFDALACFIHSVSNRFQMRYILNCHTVVTYSIKMHNCQFWCSFFSKQKYNSEYWRSHSKRAI